MLQPQKVEAIYKNGVLHPLEPLEGFVEHCKVRITIEREETTPHPLLRFAGIFSDEEAAELRHLIENEVLEKEPQELIEEVHDFIAFVQKRWEYRSEEGKSWSDFSLNTGVFDFWNDPEEVEYSLEDLKERS